MKKSFLLFLFSCLAITASAQTPQGFNYQAVARNTSGLTLTKQTVGLQISLLQESATGMAVYTETHHVTSNNIGLLNLVVGNGTATTGTFSGIDWSAGPYFIEISMDATGGTSYVLMGTQQLMSVPYALYAANAGTSGAMGATGATGVTGNDGINGTDGTTGVTGATGTNGINGTDGTTGATGATGTNGTNGIDGTTGATGNNGIDGVAGSTGIAGATGATGNNGTDGTNGTTGATGNAGSAGATGATGATGNNGTNGYTGTTGVTGNTGANGVTGTTGVAGNTGTTGSTGVTGATGLLAAGSTAGNTPYWDGTNWINSNNIYNNGGNVGIGIPIPGEKLDVNGNVQIPAANNYGYATAKSLSLNIHGSAFQPYTSAANSASVVTVAFTSGSSRSISGGTAGTDYMLIAPVILPQGAVVTSLEMYAWDNTSTYEITGEFCREIIGTTAVTSLSSVATGTSLVNAAMAVYSATFTSTVDNQNYVYLIRVKMEEGLATATDLRLGYVRLGYTVTKAE